MLIVTNFLRFPEQWTASSGASGKTVYAQSAAEFTNHKDSSAIWLVNCDPALTLQLAARLRLSPSDKTRLVAVDIVLRAPRKGLYDTLSLPVKKFLLRRVDHFIHYFSDVQAYEKTFGIAAARSSFVPFKTNLKESHVLDPSQGAEQYILCFGRSMRDFDTFFEAVEQVPYPAAITRQDPDVLRMHGARYSRPESQLPKNLQILEDDGSADAQVRILRNAKLVVLPVRKGSMVASGISSCLNAMSLRKCVIGTAGPGMTDVFQQGEVLVVPPEDPERLAAAIRQAWDDDALRDRVAQAGYEYAKAAGGEKELYQRVVDRVAELYGDRVCAA